MGRTAPLGVCATARTGRVVPLVLAASLCVALGLDVHAGRSQESQDDAQRQGAGGTSRDAALQADGVKEPRLPGRRRAVAGLGGFVSRSKLVYAVLPESPYLLEATYVFPERSRWLVEPWRDGPTRDPADEEADRRQRNRRFQYGEAVWAIEPMKVASRSFAGEERRLARLQLELRRVAMIWPAEHAWIAVGDERRVAIEGLGVLVATLGPDGRPSELASRDADGRLRERLANVRWSPPEAEGARSWPASWDFYFGAERIWHETIESVTAPGNVSELLFLPPDRRGAGARVSLPPGATQRLELPATASWSEALEEPARGSWPLALAAGRGALARWEAQLGPERLEPRPVFHLDDAGRPQRLELRLRTLPETLPDGWRREEPSTVVRRILAGLDGVDAAAIAAMGQGLEEGEHPGPARLVVQLVGQGVGLTQLCVPVVRRP